MSLALLDELRAIGVDVLPQGSNLLIRPASKVPPELKERLKAHKAEVLEALRSRPAISSPEGRAKTGKAITCRYDWQPGYRGLRLHCVAHHHAAGTATVFRMTSCGHDVLLEMAELGILTGQAMEDSRRVRLDPNNELAHVNLGAALIFKKDWDGGIQEAREALRLNPNNASAHYCLGIALERKHNPQEALQEYRKAYELNPQNPDYRKDYERLVKKTNH